MDSFELAKILLGKKSNEGTNEKAKSTVMATGTATSDSSNGKVMVDMGGDTISYDDAQSVEIDTNISVKTGDIVQILLTGAAGTSKYPVVIGVIGRGDEQNAEIQEAKATADQANSNSEEAKKKAEEAEEKAEEAEEKAQTASENANSAKQSASAASELATSANSNANDAKVLANSANTASNQANAKAEQAETDAANAIKTANAAQSGLADANKDISSLQTSVDTLNGDISDAQKKVKENGDAIAGINQNLVANYATKTDVSDTKAAIESDISTTASGIEASVKETYASKNDVSEIKGELENKIQVNADGIESTSKKVESLASDTQDISTKLNAASKTASDAQAQADTAVANAKAAQETADTAVANAKAADDKAKTAQSQLDAAKQNVASADASLKTAKQNYDSALSTYNSLTSSTTAKEEQISAAKKNLDSAQAALNKALADVLTANHNVTEAQAVANDALKNATTAYSNASTALTNAKTAQDTANKAVADAAKANKDLAELTNTVNTQETKITQNSESISSLATRTTTVENKFTGYYTKTEADSKIKQTSDSITSTVSQTYETKTDASSKLSSAKSYTDASSSQALKDAKADTDNKLKSYSTTTQMNSAINQKADSITSTVSKTYETKTDSAGNLASAKSYADSKASSAQSGAQSYTDNKLKNYSTTSQMTSAIQQKADSITSEVKKVDHKIDDLQVGGRNLLTNSAGGFVMGFAIPNTTWNSSTMKSEISLPTTRVDGRSEVLPQTAAFESWMTLTIGSTYTQSVVIETDANIISNESNWSWYNLTNGHVVVAGRIRKIGENAYLSSSTYTIPETHTGEVRTLDLINLCDCIDLTSGTYLRFYHPKIEIGNQATDWSPAPEDLTSYTDSKIKQTSDSITQQISSVNNGKNIIQQINLNSGGLKINVDNLEIGSAISNLVTGTVNEYAINTSSSTSPTSGWSTTQPAWSDGKYIWMRTKTTTKDGTVSYSNPACITGAKGSTGATGPQGPQGPQGVKGNTGATGATGPQGPKGDTGPRGPQGPMGPQGPQGTSKNRVVYSTSDPSSTSGYGAGDIWFNHSTGGIWQFNGSAWAVHQVGTVSIKNGAVTADKITTGAVTAGKIAAGAITADKISANALNGKTIYGGTITGATIKNDVPSDSENFIQIKNGIITLSSGESCGIRDIFNRSLLACNSYENGTILNIGRGCSEIFVPSGLIYHYSNGYPNIQYPVAYFGTTTTTVGSSSMYLTSLASLTGLGMQDNGRIIVLPMMIAPAAGYHLEGVQYLTTDKSYYALFNTHPNTSVTIRWIALSF